MGAAPAAVDRGTAALGGEPRAEEGPVSAEGADAGIGRWAGWWRGVVVVQVVLCRGVGVMQELFAVLTVVCSVVGDEWRPVCESAHTWA